jgi:hypothetical protein
MKKFLTKIGMFLIIPCLTWGIIEALLPPTSFTHRHWEAMSFQPSMPSKTFWYPNTVSEMQAMGDLSHHTKKSILKTEFWKTDKLGFRNDAFVKEADILFIGDSFFVGTSLNQNEMVTSKVKLKLDNSVKIYNMAPSSFSEFDRYYKKGVLKKPKLIIYSIVERGMPEAYIPYESQNKSVIKEGLTELLEFGNINMYLSKALKGNSVKWMIARIHGATGTGIPAGKNPDMYFYNGKAQKHTQSDLYTTAKNIISYKKYCDNNGIDFLFLSMPDKETVYFDLVPFDKQPDYLFKLNALLKASHVATINTLCIYNEYRKTNKALLYHLDDTHWNPLATEIISDTIVNRVKEMQLYTAMKFKKES